MDENTNEIVYKVSSNPHVRSKATTTGIMLLVILALLPTTLFGIYNFGSTNFKLGLHVALVVVVTILAAVVTEGLYNYLMKKPQTIGDLSAVVT